MTVTRARILLVTIFILGLTAQSISIILSYNQGAIAYNDLTNLLSKLLAVYSVHLAVIFGGIFGQQQSKKPANVSATALWLAVALALGWNLLLAWRSVVFGITAFDPTQEDSVNKLISYIENIASASSFLVAGALAFFFTRR